MKLHLVTILLSYFFCIILNLKILNPLGNNCNVKSDNNSLKESQTGLMQRHNSKLYVFFSISLLNSMFFIKKKTVTFKSRTVNHPLVLPWSLSHCHSVYLALTGRVLTFKPYCLNDSKQSGPDLALPTGHTITQHFTPTSQTWEEWEVERSKWALSILNTNWTLIQWHTVIMIDRCFLCP